ncbi:oxidoreductase [Vibrio penaeicida]|uniref:oxidoreductase n=1 Tax=Vibrio penaeicida TaxID=104609 RepID=UPI000CE9E425|nr:oxidoreductase [Vibrio penaeicida]
MNTSLKDKTILIAGAGGLLGGSLVSALVGRGANIIAADVDVNRMKEKMSQMSNAEQSQIEYVQLDVTDEKSVKAFFSTPRRIDGAVNSSYPRNSTYGAHFFDVSLDSFNENLSLHLGSAFLFTQQCAEYFRREQTPFSLVNVSSIYGVIAPKFDIYKGTHMTTPVEYAAIKSAILHLNKYVIAYINDSRFRINCISPGGILDGQPESFLSAYKAETNGNGMLDVEDVLGSVLFLLSDDSKYVTGQNIVVDDGFCN